MRIATTVIAALYGLIVGSFLNVVIDRVPKRQSVVTPRSRCPRCGAPIKGRDNIPLISWLALRGRCRSCDLPISVQYPLVEAGTALLFGATALRFSGSWDLVMFVVLFAGLMSLAVIDLRHHLLPVRIVYPVFVVECVLLLAAAIATGKWGHFDIAVLSAVLWFALFFAINWFAPHALGFGDVRLVAILGLCLGWLGAWYVIVAFFAANLLGLVVGIALVLAKKAGRQTPIPFGVFLALGSVFSVFAGSPLINHFRGLR